PFLEAAESFTDGADVEAPAGNRHAGGRRPDPQQVRLEEVVGDEEGEAAAAAALDETAVGAGGVIDDEEGRAAGRQVGRGGNGAAVPESGVEADDAEADEVAERAAGTSPVVNEAGGEDGQRHERPHR